MRLNWSRRLAFYAGQDRIQGLPTHTERRSYLKALYESGSEPSISFVILYLWLLRWGLLGPSGCQLYLYRGGRWDEQVAKSIRKSRRFGAPPPSHHQYILPIHPIPARVPSPPKSAAESSNKPPFNPAFFASLFLTPPLLLLRSSSRTTASLSASVDRYSRQGALFFRWCSCVDSVAWVDDGDVRAGEGHRIGQLWGRAVDEEQGYGRACCHEVHPPRPEGSIFASVFFFRYGADRIPWLRCRSVPLRVSQINENVAREIINQRSLSHPNIIRFKEVEFSSARKP